MKPLINSFDEETPVTEISIRSDGRIYVFGLSPEVLEVLSDIWPDDVVLQARKAQTIEQHATRPGHGTADPS